MAFPLVWNRIPDIILRPAESRSGRRQSFYNIKDYLEYPVGVSVRLGEHPRVSVVLDKGDLFLDRIGDLPLGENAYVELIASRGTDEVSTFVRVYDFESTVEIVQELIRNVSLIINF